MAFWNKHFDFCEYLVKEMGYKLEIEYPTGKGYTKDGIDVAVFKIKHLQGYDKVEVNIGEYTIATLKFIPKSKTMVDIMFNQIRSEVDERQEKV